MTTFGTAFTSIGANALPGTDFVVADIAPGAKIKHHLGAKLWDVEIPTDRNIYLAGGTFAPESITPEGGRSAANVRQVMWLQFDADLLDYTGLGEAHLHGMDQAQLNRYLEAQQADLEEVFSSIGLPIHRLDYTGYGLCAYLYLEAMPTTDIEMVRAAHRAFVEAVNETAEMTLLDTSVKDAGSRITRLPGSWNVKNPEKPREVRTLFYDPGKSVTLDALRFALKRAEQRPQRRPLPSTKTLPATVAQEIVDAMKPFWTKGQKHDVSLALSGMLAKSGVPEEQALAMIEQLSAADDMPWDRAKSVRDSYARARSGLDTIGFYGLRDMIPAPALRYVSERLDRFEQAGVGVFRFQQNATSEPLEPAPHGRVGDVAIQPIPEICFDGWVGEYVKLVSPLSEAPESFHLGCGLALMGASAGRRVYNNYVSGQLFGNLYMMLVGLAGESRKDTAIKFAVGFPRHQGGSMVYNEPPFRMATDIGSSEGLIKLLSDQPNTWLYITEYQRLSRQAKRSSTGTIFSTMIGAWDAPPSLDNNTKGSPLSARLPYLSSIAAVQPRILAEEMAPEDIENGYASRWIYVPGAGGPPNPYPPNINERDAYQLYSTLLRTFEGYAKNNRGETPLTLTPAAIERWSDWYIADKKQKSRDEDEASIRSRLGVHSQKLALLYAASAGASAIDLPHLESAIAFVEWSWSHTRKLMQTWGVPVFNQIEVRIETVLRDRGPMKRRVLQGLCRGRKWGAREFSQVFAAMQANGQIDHDPENNVFLVEEG